MKASLALSLFLFHQPIELGLLNGNSSYDATAAEEAEFNRLMKKKKAKRKRGFHL